MTRLFKKNRMDSVYIVAVLLLQVRNYAHYRIPQLEKDQRKKGKERKMTVSAGTLH